jgi:hypothetical protein
VNLATDDNDAAGQMQFLQKYLVDENCTFKGEPMPTLLKPNFLSTKQTQTLIYAVEKISSALNKFIDLYIQEKDVRDIMNFSARENELFSIEPGYELPLVIARLDAFMDNYTVRFLEFNCDSPAGLAYSDVMEDGFKELFKQYQFLKEWKIEYFRRQNLLLKSLLTCYKQFKENNPKMPDKPVIAIVDWEDVSTKSEFELLQNYFGNKGYKTVVTSPQKFQIKNGKATANGVEIHLIYKRVISRELLERWDDVQGFVNCIKQGVVCCCNSFRSYIVGNKKVLSVIADPQFQYIYTEEEVDVIRQTIPWTQVLADKKVSYKNVTVDLKSFVLDNRELLVLKPANSYGGKNVYLGRETDQKTWEEVMSAHLNDEAWVVQEYVDIPQEIFPMINGDVMMKLKKVNINPFALLGKYSGTITRVSDNSVINVSAGGGLVPTFSVVRRKDVLQ